jgi:Cu-Zn family superoxide dismutase
MSLPICAIAVFDSKIKGIVRFTETNDNHVEIEVHLTGLKKNHNHGFHVHECGDMSEQCESMCAHFNPYNTTHGGPDSKIRHVGDLGNIQSDQHGRADYKFTDHMIKLRGTKCNIIGRGLIIHADEDDLGLGRFPDSLTTGHAGKRIACAVIGYAKPIVKSKIAKN